MPEDSANKVQTRRGPYTLAAKVGADAARARRALAEHWGAVRAQGQVERFKVIYDRINDDPFPENPNMKRCAFLPKLPHLRNADSGTLSTAALAVYPVLCTRADYDGRDWLQLSRENIARLAGLSTHTVDNAVRELERATMPVRPGDHKRVPLLERQQKQQDQRCFYLYRPRFIRPKEEGDDWKRELITFHGQLVDDSRTWARLSQRAKALYLSARSAAYFDREIYQELEGVDLDDAESRGDFFSRYAARKWDVCGTPLAHLCATAGISTARAARVRAELARAGLVEVMPLNGRDRAMLVYLRSYDLFEDLRREQLIAEGADL